jgi:hypothetical protein
MSSVSNVRNLKRKIAILTSGGQDSVRFYLLRLIARFVMPAYRLRWHSLSWWDDADFNAFLDRFGERTSLNIDRRFAVHQLLRLVANVPGDTAECGVYLGATSFLIAKANQSSQFPRTHFLFDSFAGLSEPKASDGGYWRKGDLSAGEDAVRSNLRDCGNLVFMKGWIPERFAEVADRRFAFLHIDVDLYEPTRDAIAFFYPRLNDGGVMVLDDLGFTTCPGVARAIDEAPDDIAGQLIALPDGGGFLIKGAKVTAAARLSDR